jgi:hypothetical protein
VTVKEEQAKELALLREHLCDARARRHHLESGRRFARADVAVCQQVAHLEFEEEKLTKRIAALEQAEP